MKGEVITATEFKNMLLSNSCELKEEVALWHRAENNSLHAGEHTPASKSEALICIENTDDFSLFYRYSELSPEDIAIVIMPQLASLEPAFKLFLLTDSTGNGFQVVHEIMDRIVNAAHETLFFRQDRGHDEQILIGIYTEKQQELLRMDALSRLVIGKSSLIKG